MGVPAPGVIIDRYQVEGPVGAGSMGDVVKAIDIDLKRIVAIKILSHKHRDDQELEARFVREGRAVAAISHTNVVQVFTTGTWDGRPYIAMEFLTGRDLGGFVAERGPMSSLHAARAVLDSAFGLQAAADAGLIHRDVKPSNLVMLDSGLVKVTDFGLAKPLDPSTEPALTAMGVVVGTPDYIAPEQARGEAIDERVDLYALGGTLYYLLVGKPPFRKGNPADDKYLKVVARHLKDPAPNPMLIVPGVDAQLARLQLRLMSKKPEGRPSYPDLIAELTEIVDRLGGARASTAPATMPVTAAASAPADPTPFLGRNRQAQDATPTGDELIDSAETTVRPVVLAPDSGARPAGRKSSAAYPRAKRSKALLASTMLSLGVFLVGLGLFLFGPLPDAKSSTAVRGVIDAGVVAKASPPDAAPRVLEVPEGMLLVPASEHHAAFFISKDLVNRGDFSDIFPNQKKPTRNRRRRRKPATNVSFAYAQAYARTKGARLPTPVELLSAQALPDFEPETRLWEWLDDGTQGTQAPRPVGKAGGKADKRRPRSHKDVGFRLVIEP